MSSRIPRPTAGKSSSEPERSNSQSSNDSSRRTSSRLAAKTTSRIPEPTRTLSQASVASVESTSSQDDFVKPKRTAAKVSQSKKDDISTDDSVPRPKSQGSTTKDTRSSEVIISPDDEKPMGRPRTRSSSRATSAAPESTDVSPVSIGRSRRSTRANSVISDTSDIPENVFNTPKKSSSIDTPKSSQRKSRGACTNVVELDVINEDDDIVICSQADSNFKTPPVSPSRSRKSQKTPTPTRMDSSSRLTRSMRKRGINTPEDEFKPVDPVICFESDDEEKASNSPKKNDNDNDSDEMIKDFVVVPGQSVPAKISPVNTPTKKRNSMLVRNLTKALFTPLDSPKPPTQIIDKAGTPLNSNTAANENDESDDAMDWEPIPLIDEEVDSKHKSTVAECDAATVAPESIEKQRQVTASQEDKPSSPESDVEIISRISPVKSPRKETSKKEPSMKNTPKNESLKKHTPKKESPKKDIHESSRKNDLKESPKKLSPKKETLEKGASKIETPKKETPLKQTQKKETPAKTLNISSTLQSISTCEKETMVSKDVCAIGENGNNGVPASSVAGEKKSVQDQIYEPDNDHSSKASSKPSINTAEDISNEPNPDQDDLSVTEEKNVRDKNKIKKKKKKEIASAEQSELAVELKNDKKGKKATALSVQSGDEEDLVDPAQDDEKKDNGFYAEVTFKSLFKKPITTEKKINQTLAELYTWTCKLRKRKNDLCDVFLNDQTETIWQQISHKNIQLFKTYKKYNSLLDEKIELINQEEKCEDDEDEEDIEDEEFVDDEEDMDEDEEEEEADLFNLKGEDLADLEKKLEQGEDSEDDDESSKAPKKKFPKSPVDDKFFNLAEMDAFLDEAEKQTDNDDGLLLTTDDNWGGPADYKYEDFFGKLDNVVEGGSKKEKKPKKRSRENETDESSLPKKKKSVRWMDEQEAAEDEDEDEDVDDDAEVEDEEVEDGPVLLGEQAEEDEEPKTKLRQNLKKLKETIQKIEEENLQPRSWELSGEVSAVQRSENELLEKHLDFERGMKKAPEVNEDFTEKLESIILQRIKDNVFDDVVRKKKVEERVEDYRNEAIEEREMVKKSLSEVYEKEYQQAAGEVEKDKPNELHVSIKNSIKDLFRLIDALSHNEYTPPEVRPEVRVVSNMDALRVEEVGIMASTDSQLLAPEEVKKREKGDIKADDERTTTDKLRQRRKKKMKQRAMVMVMGDTKTVDEGEKKKKKKNEDEGASLKSSNFFNQLQETVQKELKEKTSKKKKMKSENVSSSGGSKFKL